MTTTTAADDGNDGDDDYGSARLVGRPVEDIQVGGSAHSLSTKSIIFYMLYLRKNRTGSTAARSLVPSPIGYYFFPFGADFAHQEWCFLLLWLYKMLRTVEASSTKTLSWLFCVFRSAG